MTAKQTSAEAVKAQVQTVKDRAQALVEEIEADKAVAEEKLSAAAPALAEAEAALQVRVYSFIYYCTYVCDQHL